MNFDYNETQSMIAQSIKDFAEKNMKYALKVEG